MKTNYRQQNNPAGEDYVGEDDLLMRRVLVAVIVGLHGLLQAFALWNPPLTRVSRGGDPDLW